jgi:hypothetical protein
MTKRKDDVDYKEHTDDPAPMHPGQVLDPAGGPPAPEGQYHGLTPEQVKKIEDARFDDTSKMPEADAGMQQQQQAEHAHVPEPEAQPTPAPVPPPERDQAFERDYEERRR